MNLPRPVTHRFLGIGFILAVTLQIASGQVDVLRGGDVSEIPQVEAAHGRFLYQGKPLDPFVIMRRAGWNYVRLRVWNHPQDGFCDELHTLAMARRAKAVGLKISIDFHYSDSWADPGKQIKPAAWAHLDFSHLTEAVEAYTRQVIGALVAQGTPPSMVQIGNEIGAGMLWPDGQVGTKDPQQWAHLAALLKAGVDGAREGAHGLPVIVMLHLQFGGDNAAAHWWLDHLLPYHVPFDAIGLSYYPFWHGHLDVFRANIDELADYYHRNIYVVETAYPWTAHHQGFSEILSKLEPGLPATPAGQAAFVARVMTIIREVPGGRGRGLLYWAPMWISTPQQGVPWDTLATFDDGGNALPSVDVVGRGMTSSGH